MLVQLPSGSSDQAGPQDAEGCSPFEAGLRRDLASAPIVSYDVMLGGVAKRTVDLAFTLLTLPLWLPLLAASAAFAKLAYGGRVFVADDRIGYGGRQFRCLALRMEPRAANDKDAVAAEGVPADAPSAISNRAEPQQGKWRRALERLPQFFNVIAGDMAVVGPRPLTREQLEPLRTARRYYLSARPGVVGVRVVASGEREDASQYKTYAMAWALTTDVLILSDQLRSLWDRGANRRPAFNLAKLAPWKGPRRAAADPPQAAQDTL
jgi:lipopolysaccharide/colanic/teichoic acid biosynthesis glycosyltransferase